MRILLKCPTRGRREKFLSTIQKWVEYAETPDQLGILVSADVDDVSMRGFTEADLPDVPWKKVCFGNSKTKIQACNADMETVDWDWEIVVLVSDDMIPEVVGYDTQICSGMKSLDHVVWIYDGCQNNKLNTLNIFGRIRYANWGYLYHPAYKSFYCDNELTDWCRENPSKCSIIEQVLIRHIHPLTVSGVNSDAVYDKNQVYIREDSVTYERRKLRASGRNLGFLKLLSRA